MIAPAAAHIQTVHPPAQETPTVAGPISQPWAQAHCNANSPTLVHLASNGVVTFSPTAARPCLTTAANPSGQVHPHAVDPE